MKKNQQNNIPTGIGTVILFALTLIVIMIYSYYANIQRNSTLYEIPRINIPKTTANIGTDPLNAYYLIDNKTIKLENGLYEKDIENSSAKEMIKILGNPTIGDLNDDGIQDDAAVILTQDSGGSGTFYYVAAAIKNSYGYKGSNTVFLGDRITIDKVNIKKGLIEITYLDRAEQDLMSDKPSVQKTISLKVEGNVLASIIN
jgi:hypothetical protein